MSIPKYTIKYPGCSAYDIKYEKWHRQEQKERWENKEYRISQTAVLKRGQNTKEARSHHRIGANNYFANRTEKQREYTVAQVRKSWKDKEKRANRVNALREAHRSPEGRKNHSEAVKKLYRKMNKKEREKRKQKLRSVWAKPNMRRKLMKLSKIGLKAAMSPEACKKKIAAANTPEAKNRRRMRMLRTLKSMPKVSTLNIRFKEALSRIGLFPKTEYQIDFYLVDFCFPDKKVVVEVDGDYWHGNPEIYGELNKTQKRVMFKDRREKTFLENRGWKLLRFWEKDINKSIKRCVKKVQEVVK
jgi:very-short-patch-repair endonuclease